MWSLRVVDFFSDASTIYRNRSVVKSGASMPGGGREGARVKTAARGRRRLGSAGQGKLPCLGRRAWVVGTYASIRRTPSHGPPRRPVHPSLPAGFSARRALAAGGLLALRAPLA